MKCSKFFASLFVASLCVVAANAQKEIPDSTELLFDSNGSFTRVVATPNEVKAKIITKNPMIDDVVWRKSVLRIIDLREQANRPLYYPYTDLEPEGQKNLFSIMFANFLDGKLVGYKLQSNPEQTFVPRFAPENKVDVETFVNEKGLAYLESTYDKVNYITPGVVKYYIQEVWWFDKKTSTFDNKILAIAPLYDKKYGTEDVETGVWFWFPFEKLRPFLQEEFIKLNGRNVAPLVNFDEFFITRQFYSYIVKDYDLESKDVDKGIEDPDFIKQEQERIENDISNFEQDLWSY